MFLQMTQDFNYIVYCINMPVVRLCPHCKKGFLASTYQMLAHVEKYHKDKSVIVHVNNTSLINKSKNVTRNKVNKTTPQNINDTKLHVPFLY